MLVVAVAAFVQTWMSGCRGGAFQVITPRFVRFLSGIQSLGGGGMTPEEAVNRLFDIIANRKGFTESEVYDAMRE